MRFLVQSGICLAVLCTAALALAEGPDRSGLPTPGKETTYVAPAVQTYTLENGVSVWHIQQDQAPLVSMQVILPRGASTDPADKAGTASMMVDMLDEGAGDRDALQISDAFAQLATDYNASASTDTVVFSLNMLAEELTPSLALLTEIITTPTFPQKDFDRIKAQRESRAIQTEADPSSTAFVVARRVMFQDGYGAIGAAGTRDTLARITLEDVKAAYASLIQPAGATIVAVGAVDKETLLTALNGSLGTWKAPAEASEATPAAVNPEPAARGIHFVDFPGSSQSMVIVARRAPGNKADDYFPATVFNREFAGGFTGRINMNLREDKGYTYGARGGFIRSNQAGTYAIYSKVKSETTRASLDEILGELTMIHGDKPLTEAELSAAKGNLIKKFPARFERISSVAGQLGSVAAKDYPADWFSQWVGKVNAVDLAAATETGRKYTDPAGFHIIVAGDWARIGESLKGLEMPLFFYDAQGNRIEAPAAK